MKTLEDAARARSEADWVGMNATRAASIRLRAAFDGAVSLGRVQTPTLALIARREEEIRAFKPEPYWLVEARFAASGERAYTARYLGGKRLPSEDEAKVIVDAVSGQPARSPSSRRRKSARPQLLYDLTRCSATPTRSTASRPAAPWPPRSGSTRSTRRSPIRAPTRAS